MGERQLDSLMVQCDGAARRPGRQRPDCYAFLTIKEDIINPVDGMITQMQADPEMAQLIVNKALPDKNE